MEINVFRNLFLIGFSFILCFFFFSCGISTGGGDGASGSCENVLKVHPQKMNLCGDIGVSIEPSKEGTFDAKCVWRIDGWHDSDKIDYLVDKAFFRAVFTKVIGKELHIYYSGDSLLETPDPAVVHRKLTLEESKKIHAEFEERSVGTPAHGTFINEMVFPLDMPVYTITYHRNVENFKGFKPLKLDASDLPLEHFDLP